MDGLAQRAVRAWHHGSRRARGLAPGQALPCGPDRFRGLADLPGTAPGAPCPGPAGRVPGRARTAMYKSRTAAARAGRHLLAGTAARQLPGGGTRGVSRGQGIRAPLARRAARAFPSLERH